MSSLVPEEAVVFLSPPVPLVVHVVLKPELAMLKLELAVLVPDSLPLVVGSVPPPSPSPTSFFPSSPPPTDAAIGSWL